jgi:NADPH-dependent 2,4-dienoyl-CoA reductase/sulfur reductase-like enzyme
MSKLDVIIVGAGLAGLSIAQQLGKNLRVMLIDRVPATGGILGYDCPIIRDTERLCVTAGVEFLLGTTALRWDGSRLLVAGPQGIRWLEARHLVYAGGGRPSTQAELGIAGSRLAGVMPATVAAHLLEIGVRLGNHIVIVGSGDWATHVIEELKHQQTRISVVVLEGESMPSFVYERWIGWKPFAVRGTSRVNELQLARDSLVERIVCDAVVLAGHPKPLRNVDGAVFSGTNVTFVQLVENVSSIERIREHALASARALMGSLRDSYRNVGAQWSEASGADFNSSPNSSVMKGPANDNR